jgi:phospholipid/cholesterol/gamma-HCH transport system ATP-binding protein
MNVDKTDIFIKVEDMSFYRKTSCIFKDVNINIPRGKITAIMGSSGIGKTTLLKLIGAQLKPDLGKIYLDETNIHTLNTLQLYQFRRRMGMLFQSGALFTDLNVFDNVAFPLREHTQLPESIIKRIVLMKLEAVGLRGAHQMQPNQLSGGMARRISLARAIALEPELMMFDEPFAGQDPISMGILVTLIAKLTKVFNLTTIVVSHDVDEIMSIADYCYVISEQKVVAHDTPQALKKANNPYVKQFLAGNADGPLPFHMPAPSYQEELLS